MNENEYKNRSDDELVSYNIHTNTLTSRQVTIEMMRRLKDSNIRSGNIMIFLTLALVALTLVLIYQGFR